MGKHTVVAALGMLLTVLIGLEAPLARRSVAATPEEIEFFEKKIRPLLVLKQAKALPLARVGSDAWLVRIPDGPALRREQMC